MEIKVELENASVRNYREQRRKMEKKFQINCILPSISSKISCYGANSYQLDIDVCGILYLTFEWEYIYIDPTNPELDFQFRYKMVPMFQDGHENGIYFGMPIT